MKIKAREVSMEESGEDEGQSNANRIQGQHFASCYHLSKDSMQVV